MKKFIVLALALLLVCGCSSKKEDVVVKKPETLGEKLAVEFKDIVKGGKSDCVEIADALCASETLEVNCLSTEAEEGFLTGFSSEVTGFKAGAVFMPMISSIPFVAYVFEADDPAALVEELKSKADLRWNICTEADEMVADYEGNLVFFVMCPKSFEE